MVAGITTTYAYCEFESRSWRGVLDTALCDKFVSDLRQVGGFPRVSSTNKTYRHDISEILLEVALNTITQTNKQN